MSSAVSLRDALREYDEEGLSGELLAELSPGLTELVNGVWPLWAHDYQAPPEINEHWTTWLLLGGRGAGKTRAGAEWVRNVALGNLGYPGGRAARIALIGETEHDAREVMVEGVSGLFAVHTFGERPAWISSRRRLEWPNGAIAQVFSAEDPESLRGPQFSAAWLDELAKWRQGQPANITVQIATPDPGSFRRSEAYITGQIARAVARGQRSQ
jgi:phage terminase large subunit-like protein